MDIGRVFSRSLEISWRYKFLWVFGFVMALTGGGGGGNASFRSGGTNQNVPSAPNIDPAILAAIALVALCLFLIFLILAFYFRFVARGALVSTVRDIENGSAPTLGSAWRTGQTFYTRLLGLGLLVNVPLLIFVIVVLAIAILPFVGTLATLGSSGGRDLEAVSRVLGVIALVCCALSCIIIVSLVIHPLYEFAVRAIVLENKRAIEGWSEGVRRVRAHIGSVIGLYLLLIAARIAWGIATAIVAIPLVLVVAAVVLGASQVGVGAAIAVGLLIGIPALFIVVFLDGLFQVFESNVWTEGYLALMQAADPTTTAPLPNPPVAAPSPL